jgi:hypothetical protein
MPLGGGGEGGISFERFSGGQSIFAYLGGSVTIWGGSKLDLRPAGKAVASPMRCTHGKGFYKWFCVRFLFRERSQRWLELLKLK